MPRLINSKQKQRVETEKHPFFSNKVKKVERSPGKTSEEKYQRINSNLQDPTKKKRRSLQPKPTELKKTHSIKKNENSKTFITKLLENEKLKTKSSFLSYKEPSKTNLSFSKSFRKEEEGVKLDEFRGWEVKGDHQSEFSSEGD